jgi:phospholipid/cholesterol/gamma-HCH transport system substrate-binding protein
LKVRNEITVGALTIISVVILILGYNYLKGNDVFKKTEKYLISFDNVTGLYKANAVVINGHEIGRVSDIYLDKNSTQNRILVEISLPGDVKIPVNSKFRLASMDLLGKKGISVEVGNSKEFLKPGVIYLGEKNVDFIQSLTEQLEPIKNKTEMLMTSLDSMLKDVHDAIGSGENNQLKKTLTQLNTTLSKANMVMEDVSAIISKEKQHIESLIANAEGTISNANTLTKKLADNSEKIDKILADIEQFSGKVSKIELEATINSAREALDEVNLLLQSVNAGEGTLGKIVKDENLYERVDSTISSLNFLLQDLQANPKRYVSFSLIERKNKQ